MKLKTMMIIRIVLWSALLIAGVFILCSCRQDLTELYNDVNPSIVWIGAELGPNDYEYYDDYKEYEQGIKWQGSGFIINSDGLIATAGHMVENTETFQLVFSDGRKGKANFAYMEDSEYCDVDFIQITWIEREGFHILEYLNPTKVINYIIDRELPTEPIKNLPYVKFADKIEIAEIVIIVGYPWGLQPTSTITQGIVSALERDVPFFGTKFMIHTDTASWPGNSGSPVFNLNRDVVGILVGGRYGCDNYSLVTPSYLVELALNKYEANEAMRETK